MNTYPNHPSVRVGVIADTHGLLRPEAMAALAETDLILHAGDIGKPEVLEALKTLAPVIAVRGNNDQGSWAEAIPEHETIAISGISIHLLHILKDLTLDPKTAGIRVVISGHSHQPLIEAQENVLFLNPGSAGPRRFKLPVTLAHLHLDGPTVQAQIVELAV